MKFVAGVLAAVAGVGASGIVLVGGDAVGFVGAEGIHLHARSWLAGVGIPVALLVYYGILALERRRILATQLAVAAAGHSEQATITAPSSARESLD